MREQCLVPMERGRLRAICMGKLSKGLAIMTTSRALAETGKGNGR